MIRLVRKPRWPCRDVCYCNYDAEWLRADIMLETIEQVRPPPDAPPLFGSLQLWAAAGARRGARPVGRPEGLHEPAQGAGGGGAGGCAGGGAAARRGERLAQQATLEPVRRVVVAAERCRERALFARGRGVTLDFSWTVRFEKGVAALSPWSLL